MGAGAEGARHNGGRWREQRCNGGMWRGGRGVLRAGEEGAEAFWGSKAGRVRRATGEM